jgi:hypothetical protein
LAAVASRSSLVCALLRSADPATRLYARSFLQGLSLDELKCLAEFQGAYVLESMVNSPSPYRLLPEFFDSAVGDRWPSPEDRAHKTFVVLEWLEHTQRKPITSVSVSTRAVQAA